MWSNTKVKHYIEEQIYTQDNILGKIQGAMKENDISKKELLIKDIISVGEYK